MNMRSYTCSAADNHGAPNLMLLAPQLKIVSEVNRLRLLSVLEDGGEHCVCELNEHASDLSQSLISHHLRDLRNAGLVISSKRGLRVYYRLTDLGMHIVGALVSLTQESDDYVRATN